MTDENQSAFNRVIAAHWEEISERCRRLGIPVEGSKVDHYQDELARKLALLNDEQQAVALAAEKQKLDAELAQMKAKP